MYSTTRESVTVAKTFKFTLMSEDGLEKIVSRLSTFYLNVNRYVGTDDFNECLSVVELKNRSWSLFNNQITQGLTKPIVAMEDSWTSRLITRNSQSILLAPCDAFDLIYIDQDDDQIVMDNSADVASLLRLSQKWPKDAIHLRVQFSTAYLSRLNEAKQQPLPSDAVRHAPPEYLHQDIHCRGCQGEVRGYRYICIQCLDYDLCAKCEATGCHPHHIMIRLLEPPVPCLSEVRRLMASQIHKKLEQDDAISTFTPLPNTLSGLNLNATQTTPIRTHSGRHASTSDWTMVEGQNVENPVPTPPNL